jgi:hypothetical protein
MPTFPSVGAARAGVARTRPVALPIAAAAPTFLRKARREMFWDIQTSLVQFGLDQFGLVQFGLDQLDSNLNCQLGKLGIQYIIIFLYCQTFSTQCCGEWFCHYFMDS